MENDLFILGDTNINILDNGENMSKRKSNLGAIPKKYAQICSTLGLKQLKSSYENNISHLNSN